MGGDRAPGEIAKGALEAVAEMDVTIALIGTKEALAATLDGGQPSTDQPGRIEPVVATQIVDMAESPTDSWRDKKDSSIAVGVRLVKEGRAGAFISAGNTGAIATASIFTLGMMEGIERPAIATLYRTLGGQVSMILDIGANADCRPKFLLQFGEMGSSFMFKVFQVQRPRVALLSNGTEEEKGSRLVKEAHKLLKESDLNFIGNVEGYDLVRGVADVIVTDGFTGNVILKLAESLTGTIFMSLKDALGSSALARASKMLWGPPIKSVVRQWDYSTVGGAPLLGVNGNIVMAHGKSEASDIKRAVELARRMAKEGWYRGPVAAESSTRSMASNP